MVVVVFGEPGEVGQYRDRAVFFLAGTQPRSTANAWGCRLVGTWPLLGSSASLPLAPLSTTQVFDRGLTEVLTSPNKRS